MTLTQVNSAGIADGAIVNADINNSAAVALSKLATSGTASSSNYLRGDGAWSAIDLSTKLNLTGGTLTGNVIHNDSVKALFGTGSDLEIYHDGSNSYIHENGTGDLYIRGDNYINIANSAGNENKAKFITNGAVELYYDNSKKFETNSNGIQVQGRVQVSDFIETFTDDTNLKLNSAGSNGQIKFYINGSEKAKFDSSGNFSINNDSGKITFGTGNDLKIYHDGSNSYITNSTSNLVLSNSNTDSKSISLYGDSGLSENLAHFIQGGAVQLYYDNALKLTTLSGGVQMANGSGNNTFSMYDSDKLSFGNSGDLKLYHDGSHARIHNSTGVINYKSSGYYFANAAGTENCLDMAENGAVELYYDNVKKLETNSEAVMIHGITRIQGAESTDAILILQADEADDFDDYWKLVAKTNGDFAIENIRNTVGWETNLTCTGNGAVDLYYDNFKTFKTISNGITLYGPEGTGCTLHMYPDDGDDNADKWMIQANESGYWYIKNKASGSWETNIETVGNGHVGLYYDNSLKFYTQSTKNVSAGHFYPESNNTYDLGNSSYRWANLYVNDMHFANSPENTNSVDGTWGDWTLQEGDENIFMINNRTGRKYKMGLVEVS